MSTMRRCGRTGSSSSTRFAPPHARSLISPRSRDRTRPGTSYSASWRGLSRPSTSFSLKARKQDVDARDKRGGMTAREERALTPLPPSAQTRIGLKRHRLRPDMISHLGAREVAGRTRRSFGEHCRVPGIPLSHERLVDILAPFLKVDPFQRILYHFEQVCDCPGPEGCPIS